MLFSCAKYVENLVTDYVVSAVLRQMIVHGFPKFHAVLEALVSNLAPVIFSFSLCLCVSDVVAISAPSVGENPHVFGAE